LGIILTRRASALTASSTARCAAVCPRRFDRQARALGEDHYAHATGERRGNRRFERRDVSQR
jgi:hypothetical protein